MKTLNPTLAQLYSRIRRGKTDILPFYLQNPQFKWREAEDKEEIINILKFCPPAYKTAVRAAIAAALLKEPATCPMGTRKTVKENIQPQEFGLEMDWGTALSIRWEAVQVPLASGGKTGLNTFLLGWKKGENRFILAEHTCQGMDSESLQALKRAMKLAGGKHGGEYHCLRTFGTGHSQVSGRSLTLPVYCACVAAAEDWHLPNILLSGDINEDGTLNPVSLIEEKREAVLNNNYSGLICPLGSDIPENRSYIIPVSTAKEALLLCKADSPRLRPAVKNFIAQISDPGKSVLELRRLDSNCLDILKQSCQEEVRKTCLDALLYSREDMNALVSELEEELEKPDWSTPRIQKIMALMPEAGKLHELVDKCPDIVFRLARVQYMLHNHAGQLDEGDPWAELSKEAAARIAHIEKNNFSGLAQSIKFHAGRLVRERHNAFIFKPDIPQDLDPDLRELIKNTEQYYLQIKKISPVNRHLGAFWGTLTQNFAFCGPEYIESTREYALRAWEAFGADDGLEDCRRCISYLYFAHLDASLIDEAYIYLKRISSDKDLETKNNLRRDPFAALALVRWMNEIASFNHDQLTAIKKAVPGMEIHHPWQLVLYNIARIDPDPREAHKAAKQGLEFCIGPNVGPPVRAMGLLPLSLLHSRKQIYDIEAKKYYRKIIRTIYDYLNTTGHFNCILNLPHEKALPNIECNLKRLFPFTYR